LADHGMALRLHFLLVLIGGCLGWTPCVRPFTSTKLPIRRADSPAAALPATTTTIASVVNEIFIRDPVDFYYGAMLVAAAVYFGKGFVADLLNQAKAQDEAAAAARADGRAELTDAFKKAAKEKR